MALNPLFQIRLAAAGYPQHLFAFSAAINFPFQMATTYFVADKLQKPLDTWLLGYKFQLVLSLLCMSIIYFYPPELSNAYIFIVIVFSVLANVSGSIMFVSLGTFFAKISDARIGGTYLTLVNTISNFGGTWPHFFVFYLVDLLSQTKCISSGAEIVLTNGCSRLECAENEGECVTTFDGYFLVGILGVGFGLWIIKNIKRNFVPLQFQTASSWVKQKESEDQDEEQCFKMV